MMDHTPIFTNDATVLGLLLIVLAFIFYTSSSNYPFWKKFYTYIPALLLCYFLPSVLNSAGLISGEESSLYFMASRYLLPASLVLLTFSYETIVKEYPAAEIADTYGTICDCPRGSRRPS